MFCTGCGTQLKETQKFCTNCGSPIEAQPPTTTSHSSLPVLPVTGGRQPASKSSAAPAVEALSALPSGSVATAEHPPRPVAVPSGASPSISASAAEIGETAAPRRGISPLLLWGGAGALVVIAAVAVILVLHSSSQPAPVPDAEIERSIQSKFSADPDISKCTLEVRSQNGVVTLTGLVNKASDRSTADNIVRQQAGVKTVVDNLVLTTDGGVGQGAKGESNPVTQPGLLKTVTVLGNQAWTPTGIFLHAGTVASIAASGEVSMGGGWPLMSPTGKQPNCGDRTGFPAPYLPCWSLIGRVGEQGPVFYIGSGITLRAPKQGELFLGVNDDQVGDNSGTWTAKITLQPSGNSSPVNVSSVNTLPPSTAAAPVTWLGFANGNAAQDRDSELHRNCGNFNRVYVPDNIGNKFTDLCGYVGKTCEKVCDWQGNIISCDAISQGGNRDGTRVASCR